MLITLLVHTRANRAAVLRKRCSCSSDVQRCCAFSARCCAFSTARCCAFSAARCCARCCAFSAARCCCTLLRILCCTLLRILYWRRRTNALQGPARGKHAAPGHRVDMSSRLPPYFTQTKSNIPLLTRLCCGPWPPPMLHSIAIPFFAFLRERGFMLRRHLQKMHRPYEYCTFRNT